LDQLPIRKYFSICICADDTKEHKPSAQPLLKYMELSGARKEETVYIGDSASDMACALNAGVDCVHAVWGEPETEADATYRAGKPEQLEEIFL
ncbi:MAG: HAD family hydrolase, partial [[Ruminococcus] torques]